MIYGVRNRSDKSAKWTHEIKCNLSNKFARWTTSINAALVLHFNAPRFAIAISEMGNANAIVKASHLVHDCLRKIVVDANADAGAGFAIDLEGWSGAVAVGTHDLVVLFVSFSLKWIQKIIKTLSEIKTVELSKFLKIMLNAIERLPYEGKYIIRVILIMSNLAFGDGKIMFSIFLLF